MFIKIIVYFCLNIKKIKMIKKVLKLGSLEYYNTHLQIINPLLPIHLTPKEIEVLAYFMSFDGVMEVDRFGTTARKIVKEKLNLSNAGISNYMKSLKTKGFISDNDILPILFPSNGTEQYQFKLVNIDKH